MGETTDEKELSDLSDIYASLKSDAKQIVSDLHGGVLMWREAASGAAASAGLIVILILTAFHFSMFGGGGFEFWAYVIGAGVVAVVMGAVSVAGFWRYRSLSRRYAGLFSRAQKLD